jgi:hypothetical protein
VPPSLESIHDEGAANRFKLHAIPVLAFLVRSTLQKGLLLLGLSIKGKGKDALAVGLMPAQPNDSLLCLRRSVLCLDAGKLAKLTEPS